MRAHRLCTLICFLASIFPPTRAVAQQPVTADYPVANNGNPDGIALGPDGAMWYTDPFGGQIGRITTAGVYTIFNTPTIGSHPLGITAGPDGALWFAELDGGQIGRITTDGVVSEYPTEFQSP